MYIHNRYPSTTNTTPERLRPSCQQPCTTPSQARDTVVYFRNAAQYNNALLENHTSVARFNASTWTSCRRLKYTTSFTQYALDHPDRTD
jgi:hypothetical protein